jgi:hypothetical protein
MAASAQTEPPPGLDWREIGRGGEPDHDARWTTWTASIPDGGVLYRSLVIADGAAIVSVELQARPRTGGGGNNEARTIHRRRCPAPGDSGDDGAGGAVGALLDAADAATVAAVAVAAPRVTIVGRGKPPST